MAILDRNDSVGQFAPTDDVFQGKARNRTGAVFPGNIYGAPAPRQYNPPSWLVRAMDLVTVAHTATDQQSADVLAGGNRFGTGQELDHVGPTPRRRVLFSHLRGVLGIQNQKVKRVARNARESRLAQQNTGPNEICQDEV